MIDASTTMSGAQKFPCSASFKTNFVEYQIRNSTSQLFIILLKPLKFFQLVYADSTTLLASALIGLFNNSVMRDRIQTGHKLPLQNLNLP